jgi:hypothetical protein
MKGPFFYRQENREIGPLSSHELKQHAATGELDPDDQVWTEDTPKGCTARKIKGLFPSSAVDDRGAESRPRAGPPPLPKISTPVPIAEQSHGTLGNAQRANWFRVAAGLLVATIGIWLGSRWLFPEGTGSQKSERTKDEKQVAKDTTKDTPQVTAEETTKEVWLDENDDWPRRRGVGKYVGDVAQGEFKFYDEYDRLMFVTSFKDGVEHGKFTAYYPSGAKLQEVNNVNGLMQGKRTAWHEDGALASTNDIVDGLTHGRQILYYHNGKEFVVNQYVRGVQEVVDLEPEKAQDLTQRLERVQENLRDAPSDARTPSSP